MPTNIFDIASRTEETKLDTSSFVQNLYIRTNFFESNFAEDIGMEIVYKIEKNVVLFPHKKLLQSLG